MQWGVFPQTTSVNFPIPFPNACLGVTLTSNYLANAGTTPNPMYAYNITPSGFGVVDAITRNFYIAVGY